MLLQTVLSGKAQKAYATLLMEYCAEYESVNSVILKSYELVPESYKIKNCRKLETQTYIEFAREMKTDYEQLKQLILIKEFKRYLTEKLKCYVGEKRVESAHELVILVEEYTLTHKKARIKLNCSDISRGQNAS